MYGKQMKEMRETQGYTQGDVSRGTGIKQANISRWEADKIEPTIDMCVRLADFYGITIDELIDRQPPKGEHKTIVHNSFNNNKGKINFRT